MLEGLILGGDARAQFAADYLESKGISLSFLDVPGKKDTFTADKINHFEMILLAIPSNYKNYDFLTQTGENCLILGNKYPGESNIPCRKFHSITNREDFQIWNAVPTAEAAISILIQNLPKILCESHIAVVGYGRIGKVLSDMLKKADAKVTVATRRYEDIIKASTASFDTVCIDSGALGGDFKKRIHEFDAIINTAPVRLFDSEILKQMNKNTLLLDLSSGGIGVDFEEAENKQLKAIKALGLPGKVSPQTAGNIVGKVVYQILKEENKL